MSTTKIKKLNIVILKEDNWIHKSKTMLCKTCMYYVPKYGNEDYDSVSKLGRCRRHAPTMSGWPVMFESDWCGDHKLDVDKMSRECQTK